MPTLSKPTDFDDDHQGEILRRLTVGTTLADAYPWWPQRATNPFVLWNFAGLCAPLRSARLPQAIRTAWLNSAAPEPKSPCSRLEVARGVA